MSHFSLRKLALLCLSFAALKLLFNWKKIGAYCSFSNPDRFLALLASSSSYLTMTVLKPSYSISAETLFIALECSLTPVQLPASTTKPTNPNGILQWLHRSSKVLSSFGGQNSIFFKRRFWMVNKCTSRSIKQRVLFACKSQKMVALSWQFHARLGYMMMRESSY